MKAIILAAGMGTRISDKIDRLPKCMVDINGHPLLEYTLDLLQKNGINDIGVCVGYRADYIIDKVKKFNVSFFYNPFFDVTNGIASIWFAKDFISNEEDLLIMSGDLFITPNILKIVFSTKKNPVLLVDSKRIENADYKFHYEDGVLLRHGKELSIEDTTGENLGIAIIKKDFVKQYKDNLEKMINSQKHNVWWENVLYDLIGTTNIYVEDVGDNFWAEVDTAEDYQRIENYLKNRKHE